MPVYQKPCFILLLVSCDSATPVDSSIVTCAPTARRHPLWFKIGASRSPYKAFLLPNNVEVAIALAALPPAPNTPTTAN